MIIKFKSTLLESTARCAKQNCLIEDGDYIRIQKNLTYICMFCDEDIRSYVREKEKEKLDA